jgi:DNA modification methylase
MAKLTEQEQQEIIRFLEAGKPLPDKYRFLLFDDKRELELVWNGKTNEICNVALPFQTIEQVDEPRSEKELKLQSDLFSLTTGRQQSGWSNKLIWGDNKLILSSLKSGALRQDIEKQGGLKLVYIDPPFDVGADFSMDIEIGEDTFTKRPNVLEEIAYRDTWGKGEDSFLSMLYERLKLIQSILSEDGCICLHCDWRVGSSIRQIMDEVFGKENFINEIIWYYTNSGLKARSKKFHQVHDTLFVFAKSKEFTFNHIKKLRKDGQSKQAMRKFNSKTGKADMVRDENGKIVYQISDEILENSVWEVPLLSNSPEKIGYPTQKPEALVEKVIRAFTNENDLVADFFGGSGTTAAVAEKLGRKWITSDIGKFGIHTTRKRMIAVQRDLKEQDKSYRAFEILNLGKYERQHFIGVNPNLRDTEKLKQLQEKEKTFLSLILRAYQADATDGFATFHGKKAGRLVAVGPVNLPVTRLFVEEVISECRQKHITKVDVLGFEFEMGLFPNLLDEAKVKGIDISPKYIPADVFDKRAVERNQVVFHDVSYIEIKPIVKGSRVSVELTDFSVFYSQDSISSAETHLKEKSSKVVVEKGHIVKVSKDKDGIVTREQLTKHWTDWIDYWSVDFDYESKKEFVRQPNLDNGEIEEIWTGDYVFENEWQSFRTKKDRNIELVSVAIETFGRKKIAVKVVDIFGNDTMKIVEVNI